MTPDMPVKVLTENEVVEAVHKYLLTTQRFKDIKSYKTTEKGYDIVAYYRDSDRRLIIEAKGATSACETSARYGKPFDRKQVQSHIARAFYTAAATLQKKGGNVDVGIALPQTDVHRKFVEEIDQTLHTLGILVYWVSNDGTVRCEPPYSATRAGC